MPAMRLSAPLVLLLASTLVLVRSEDPVPGLIIWFYGAPFTASYIGEGETITWRWRDAGSYSVEGEGDGASVFTGQGGGASVVSQVNFTYTVKFTKAGTYNYHCHGHPYVMSGKVVVKKKYNFGGVTLPWFLGISYGGASAIIQEGDTVTWAWGDDLPHALAAMDGDQSMFTGPGSNNHTVSGDGTFFYKKKFTKPGVYLYKCQNHGSQMQGNITVLAKDAAASLITAVPTADTPLGKDKEKTVASKPPSPPSLPPTSTGTETRPPPSGAKDSKTTPKKSPPKTAPPKKAPPKKAPAKKAPAKKTRKLR